MSQQEFESSREQATGEIQLPHYPYSWSAEQKEGMPRDEMPSSSGIHSEISQHVQDQTVPWWARPQPQNNAILRTVARIALMLVFVLFVIEIGIILWLPGFQGAAVSVLLAEAILIMAFVALLAWILYKLSK